jgi:hypothetical protein
MDADMHRLRYTQTTVGCGAFALILLGPAIFLMVALMDFSESDARGATIFALFQSIKIGAVPVGAVLLGGYVLFDGMMNAWRWSYGVAIRFDGDALIFHPSHFRKPVPFADLVSITTTYRGSAWVKTTHPTLIFHCQSNGSFRASRFKIRNVDIKCPDSLAAIAMLKQHGKWIDSP